MSAPNTTLKKGINPELLEKFVQLYSVALMRYFKKRGCQNATVDDLVQDVFIRLAARTSGQEIQNPEAYLMQTASSVWKDFLRKRKTHAFIHHVEYDDGAHAIKDFSPEEIYQDKEKIAQLIDVLNKLPIRTKQVFILCRLEGMKQKTVAVRLGVSVSSIEKHMVKAIAHLTRHFGNVR